jgi:NADH-quinone oxidoreductase subunit M
MEAWGREGAVIQMLSHGLSTGALFMLVGALQDRIGTRELGGMGGLARAAPRFGAFGLVLALALLGLPGMGNFVGELLVLFGTFEAEAVVALVAGLGLVVAMAYSLRMYQLAFHGEAERGLAISDLSALETATLGSLLAVLLWIGLYPRGALALVSLALASMTGGAAR